MECRFLLLGIVTGLRRQILGRAIGFGHSFIECRRGLEEHVGKLGPGHAGKQHRRGKDVQAEQHTDPAAAPPHAQTKPSVVLVSRDKMNRSAFMRRKGERPSAATSTRMKNQNQ